MADVQAENGFTRLADALLEALVRTRMPARHLQVVLAVARLTYGWGRKRDAIGSSQLAGLTGLEPRNVRRILADLARWRVLEVSGSSGRCAQVGIQKDYEGWSVGGTENASHKRVARDPGRARPGSQATQVPANPGRGRPANPGRARPDSIDRETEEKKQTLSRADARGGGTAGKRACPERLSDEERAEVRAWLARKRKAGEIVAIREKDLGDLWEACLEWASSKRILRHSWPATFKGIIRKEDARRRSRPSQYEDRPQPPVVAPGRGDRGSQGRTGGRGGTPTDLPPGVIDLAGRIGRSMT